MLSAAEFARAVLVGLIATAVMDLVAVLRQRLWAVPAPDYAMVGRWLGHMPRGRFRHPGIGRSPPVAREAVIGWAAHYAIGAGFGVLLVLATGPGWLNAPTLLPALLFGLISVAAPFLLMQPAMGAGFAASRTPRPWTARGRSLTAHLVFGLGLWIGAWLIR